MVVKSANWRVWETTTPEPATEPLKPPILKKFQAGGRFHPSRGAKITARSMHKTVRLEMKPRVTGQRERRIRLTPAAISRKGQMYISAHRFSRGRLCISTNSQTMPAAIRKNGQNKDRLRMTAPYFFS